MIHTEDRSDVLPKKGFDSPELIARLTKLLATTPEQVLATAAWAPELGLCANDPGLSCQWAKEIVRDLTIFDGDKVLAAPLDSRLPGVVDLFSGCGGMSLGFELARFNVVAGYDHWPDAVKTYKHNLNHDGEVLDLTDVKATIEVLERHRLEDGGFPAIVGGPPCQDFSSAGKRIEGKRADLTEKFAAVVEHFDPPFFIMENVTLAAKADAYNRALERMRDAGFSIVKQVVNAIDCGVPQKRRRLIAFGSKNAAVAEHVEEAFVQNRGGSRLTVEDWFGSGLDTNYYYRHPRTYDRRGIFGIDEPSPTIRGVNRPIPATYAARIQDKNAGPVEEARVLTTHERAGIQTFPLGFEFLGSRTANEQMIGNAVPVRMGKFIAESVKAAILEFS